MGGVPNSPVPSGPVETGAKSAPGPGVARLMRTQKKKKRASAAAAAAPRAPAS
jgi:hypothetical protein